MLARFRKSALPPLMPEPELDPAPAAKRFTPTQENVAVRHPITWVWFLSGEHTEHAADAWIDEQLANGTLKEV